jgi:lysophospholipase L1-like esterase
MRRTGFRIPAMALALCLAAGCQPVNDVPGAAGSPTAAPSATNLPSSMAALGDSLTAGFGSCFVLVSCPRNSWATGDGTLVDSHYKRILAGNPAIRGHAHNLAVPGATVADLAGQASAAVALAPAYVTVLIGANDACRPGIGEMTGVADFQAELTSALSTLHSGLPRTRVLVVSIPDVYRVWQVAHTNRTAREAWALGVCQSLLANPTSTAPADTARRQEFRDRIDAFDRVLATACAAYGPRCRYDAGAVHAVEFGPGLLSALDFFHPNASGQNQLASVTYPGRFTW